MLRKNITIALMVVAGISMVNSEAQAFFGKKKKSEIVQITGSDTCLNVTQQIAEAYMATYDDARIAVTGGGSGVGIAAAINGTTDIAMASRPAKDKEKKKAEVAGHKMNEIVFGWDGLSVIVNPNNPVNTLSSETIGRIFSGEITNWKEVGGKDAPIVLLSRDSSSGTHVYFKEAIVRGGEKKSKKEYADKTLYLPSNTAIVQETAANENAIGYIGMAYANSTIKDVSVDGVMPTPENVANKSYPIARELFWYTTKSDTVVDNIVKFALSKEGQELVAKEGFVPAK